LTNEERAALQTFPKDFKFEGTPEQVRKQIGMAVPTVGARQIFVAILKTLAKVEYKHVNPDPELVFFPAKS
jgi:DNA (cytosine-5)-methyltransferase 1